MKDGVELARHKNVIGHVVFDERELGGSGQVGDIVGGPGDEVVQTEDLVPLPQESIAQMTSDESGSAGYENSHCGLPMPSYRNPAALNWEESRKLRPSKMKG